MNKELVITAIIGIIVIGIIGVLIFKKNKTNKAEKFDISVDPLMEGPYEYLNAVTCPARSPCVNNTLYGGLNPEYDDYVTVKDYIDTYESCTGGIDLKNPTAAGVVAKRYCELLYQNHIEYFTGCKGYAGLGDCEVGTELEIQQMYPDVNYNSVQ